MKCQFVLDRSKLFHQTIHLVRICSSQLVADLVHPFFFFEERIKSGFQHLADGHPLFQNCMLIQIACVDIFCPLYLALIRHQFSGHDTHKCGLSFAISAYKSDVFSLKKPERYIFENRSVSKPVGQVFYI